jgi:murein L,D-transpeptidase YcbB/YkuD
LVRAAINKGLSTLLLTGLFLCVVAVSSAGASYLLFQDAEVALRISRKVAGDIGRSGTAVPGVVSHSAGLVGEFYARRGYQPAWSLAGRLINADALMRSIEEAYGDGLSPAYYHLDALKALVRYSANGQVMDPDRAADLDILLTDAFLTLACHYSAGCDNRLAAASKWYAKSERVDVIYRLEEALAGNRISEALNQLRPQKGIYTRLKKALAQYREAASKGEWPQLPAGPALKKGARSARVLELRQRLAASGDLASDKVSAGEIFDGDMEQAVIRFQRRHGLADNGAVGPETRAALNVSLKQRIRQMELNMERLRWILGNREERFIIVNIANFKMRVFEKDRTALSMNVVVGKPYQSTPIFTAAMTHIVINPSWHIPRSIVQKEILAKIAKNPNYLASQKIEVVGNSYRQRPGPWNALGRLKFMFPNRYDVYLHDTPSKGLFSRNVRAFSHGCIRIENPVGLAEYLLKDDPRWTRERISAAINKGTEQVVRLPRPLNVHLLYLTAWVDEEGIVQFRNDIYGRDKDLSDALLKNPYIR